jgi:hypothetical protein
MGGVESGKVRTRGATVRCLRLVSVLAFSVAFATCGSETPQQQDASPIGCGTTTCWAPQVCRVSCTGNPAYCDAAGDGGTCKPGWHLTTNCYYGPGDADAGCSNAVYSYECLRLDAGQTSAQCENGDWVSIMQGVATCCHD